MKAGLLPLNASAGSCDKADVLAGPLMDRIASREVWLRVRKDLPPWVRDRLDEQSQVFEAMEPVRMMDRFHEVFASTGERGEHGHAHILRMQALSYLTAQGLMQGAASFGLIRWIQAVCDEPTWVHPATTQGRMPEPGEPVMDLLSAMVGGVLATVVIGLGNTLGDHVAERVKRELATRVVMPFMQGTHWWLGQVPGRRLNNWTPVCSGGALLAALAMGDEGASAKEVARVAHGPLMQYLETFAPDGGCEEGPSYWVYGVDVFVLCAELLRCIPGHVGVDLYSLGILKQIARYPVDVMVGDRAWLTYSDARTTPRWSVGVLARLADETMEAPTRALARAHKPDLDFMAQEGTLLQNLLWWPESRIDAVNHADLPPTWRWFEGLEMGIARQEATGARGAVATVRAGHNGQSHNHNDVGHVTYHLDARPVLVDLGAPEYDRDYFSPKRCGYLVASSRGHSVPEVNAAAQGRGAEFTGRVLAQGNSGGTRQVTVDLTGAYPAQAGLASLVRRWEFEFATGQMTVTDAWRIVDGAGQAFTSAWVTFGPVSLRPGVVKLADGRVALAFDPELVAADVQLHPQVRLIEGPRDVYRVLLKPKNREPEGEITVTVSPISGFSSRSSSR